MLKHGIKGIRAHLATLPPMREQTVEEARQMYDKAQYVFALPEGVEVETDEIGGIPAEVVTPAEHGAGTFLYFHGGGYAIGSPTSHRHLVGALAAASRTRAFALDYRRAPEHPFPAAVDDALAGYRGLLDAGIAPGSIVLGGDSAGGGLTVATLIAIRDRGLALPAAAVCISPWTDLTNEARVVPDPRGTGSARVPGGHRPLGRRVSRGRPIPALPSRRRCTRTSPVSRPSSSRSAPRRCCSTIRAFSPSGARPPGSKPPSRSGTR